MAGMALGAITQTTQSVPGAERLQQLHNLALGDMGGDDWKSGLFDCCPCTSCVLGFFVPCLSAAAPLLSYITPSSLSYYSSSNPPS